MAATVVSVIIFLCGVLVGRGVRAERSGGAETTAMNDASSAEITPTQPPLPVAPPAAGGDPTTAAPPAPAEDLSYFKRLEPTSQPAEDLKPAASKAAAAGTLPARTANTATAQQASGPKSATAPPVPQTSGTARAAAPATSAAPQKDPAGQVASVAADPQQPPTGQGYVVQVTALNVRSEADAIAKHLSSKGYQAYVSANGTPTIYRVRVGSFKTRREAETMAAKLQKEEQLKPWVTR